MTNYASSSNIPIPQEVENPSSFNFFIPPLDESHSTPIYGVGETDESITHFVEVVASHVLLYEEIFPCSLTLVLSCDKSQNSEAQSVAKPVDEPSNENVEVASKGVSSTMSKQYFEGDLSEGRGPESNILAAGAELVAVQKEEEEPLLRWNRLTVGVLDLETANNALEVDHIAESTKTEKERQRKGKGKMVVSHSKGKKMIWNKEKRRREGHEPEKPTSTPLSIGSSDTESDHVVAYVAKKKKRGRKGKMKGITEGYKRPGPSVQNLVADKEMTRVDRIVEIENQKVLNDIVFDLKILTAFVLSNLFDVVSLQRWGHLFEPPTPYLHEPEVREFYYKMDLLEVGGIKSTAKVVEILLDEEILRIILGVSMEVIRSIKGCQSSSITCVSTLASSKRGNGTGIGTTKPGEIGIVPEPGGVRWKDTKTGPDRNW
ncbi:hypothetical protein H5410_022600 [Solanum commersonii]|uniref:Uncharacterized protein n=1 Tax=Solanum commersonii TaxID=4109 RepID=A0A9J5ZH85_SOLCO|nr:hypothetical protein H5410_022600 [Solanum commersonii]